MSDRPWLAQYPEGVPADIDPEEYGSLSEMFRAALRRFDDDVAFVNSGTSLSFAAVDRLSHAFAAYLSVELKLGKGDRVAVMLPNMLQSPVVIFGILRAGLVAVNVNPLYTPRELEHQINDSGARVIVVLENFAGTVEKARTAGCRLDTVIVTGAGDGHAPLKRFLTNLVVKYVKKLVKPWRIPGAIRYRAAIRRGQALEYEEPEIGPSDLAFLQYTGGTTGVAKGAMLTHRNMVSNVLQATSWVKPFFGAHDGVAVTPLPLYHVFALTVNLFSLAELGARNMLVTNPRDLRGLVRELERTPVAFITGVNTLFNGLLNTPGFDDLDFRHLKVALGGGMAVQADVAERWRQTTGRPISQGYGLTETSPIISASVLDDRDFTGSVGLPLPSTDVAILDESDRPLALGEVGEICVKGPQVMRGYWNRPEETAATFTADGWLKTGDIGRLDGQGRLYIEDRKKDVIIVSGFNVYPNEIENVVTAHPDVHEAAAVGIPDKRSGEAVKIFVVKKNPALTEHALLQFCRERLTGYKIPDVVEFVDALPKTNVGKVLRRALKDGNSQA